MCIREKRTVLEHSVRKSSQIRTGRTRHLYRPERRKIMFEPGKTMFPTLNIENPCNRVFRFFPLFLSLISSILSSLLFCGFSKFDLFSVFHFPGRNVSLHLRQGRTEMSLTFKLCTSLEIVICLFFKFKTLQNVSLSSFCHPHTKHLLFLLFTS